MAVVNFEVFGLVSRTSAITWLAFASSRKARTNTSLEREDSGQRELLLAKFDRTKVA